ncbi:MAG: hypothetical protein ACRDJF_12510 [Actinomycetota bacterium]
MESVVVDALSFANRALVLLSGIGAIAVSLVYRWLKRSWRTLACGQRWGDPWTDWAASSREGSTRLERERRVA